MKKFFFSLAFFFAVISHSQTVIKVTGSEALINLQGQQNWNKGDTVHFLTQSLAVAGEGKVIKVSNGETKALVKINAGKVTVGMTLERKKSETRSESVTYASLTDREREILRRGEISQTQYVLGGIFGTYPGFGIGHAIQGRYTEKGWIFTAGELGSVVALAAGIADCWNGHGYYSCNGGLAFAGLAGYIGFRIWEIVDVWTTPREQNREYIELKNRMYQFSMKFEPALLPMADGGMLGIKLTF